MPLIITTPFKAPEIPLNGLVRHWDANESDLWQDVGGTTPATTIGTSVARIDDLVGSINPQNSTVSQQPTIQTDGLFFQSSATEGLGDILLINDPLVQLIDGPFTFAIKVKLTGVVRYFGGGSSTYGGVVWRTRRGSNGWGINLRDAGSGSYELKLFGDMDLTPAPVTYALTGSPALDQILVLVTYAGAGNDMVWRVNGNVAGTHSALTIGGSGSGEHRIFRLHSSPAGGESTGYFREALFYDRVLNASEIVKVETYINNRHP